MWLASRRQLSFFASTTTLLVAVKLLLPLLRRRWEVLLLDWAEKDKASKKRRKNDAKANGAKLRSDAAAGSPSLEESLKDAIQIGFRAIQEELELCGGERKMARTRSEPVGKRCWLDAFNPNAFGELRRLWKIDEAAFWDSLCMDALSGGITQESGKSGSLFWFTADRRFVLKSINGGELRMLCSILVSYTQHFQEHPESLLCRFYGAFKLHGNGNRLIFVVMNNCFFGMPRPKEMYDLKGTSEDRWVTPTDGAVLKDLNFANKVIGIPDAATADGLKRIICVDSEYLEKQHIMDYSVILGIHDCSDVEGGLVCETGGEGLCSRLSLVAGYEPRCACSLVRHQDATTVVFQIGIIDILQNYNLKKILAHLIKSSSLGWIHEIDTEPPSYYAERFKSFFKCKIQTFQSSTSRVQKLVKRLTEALGERRIAAPLFCAAGESDCNTGTVDFVSIEEAITFAVQSGGRLHLTQRTAQSLRSPTLEVEAYLDMDRYAFVFKPLSGSWFGWPGGRTSGEKAIAVHRIRRVYPCHVLDPRSSTRCGICDRLARVDTEPEESRRFMLEEGGDALPFMAPSRRQAKLWVTALEVTVAYCNMSSYAAVGPRPRGLQLQRCSSAMSPSSRRGSRPSKSEFPVWTESESSSPPGKDMNATCRQSTGEAVARDPVASKRFRRWGTTTAAALDGKRVTVWDLPQTSKLVNEVPGLKPHLQGVDDELLFFRRRLTWVFNYHDTNQSGGLDSEEMRSILWEMNVNMAEGNERMRQLLACGTEADIFALCQLFENLDAEHHDTVWAHVCAALQCPAATEIGPSSVASLFERLLRVDPSPSAHQAEELIQILQLAELRREVRKPLASAAASLPKSCLAKVLCCIGNSIVDPHKASIFQDMSRPLAEYFIASSHNTYLEGNQLSSRASVLRYVEVLKSGCRCVEVDAWDGPNGEPVVTHGHTATTAVSFEHVIHAISDFAFVASPYPVIISVEQKCSTQQQIRQGEILRDILGNRLLRPPQNEATGDLDWNQLQLMSPQSAMGKFLVKSELCPCSCCAGLVDVYASCVALPSKKLSKAERCDLAAEAAMPEHVARTNGRCAAHISSMTAEKFERCMGRSSGVAQETCRRWNASFLCRVYPEGVRIRSGNFDPMPLWCQGVQMVALNYQTWDEPLLLNEGLFDNYNGECGYVLKPPELRGLSPAERRGDTLHLEVVCGHRLQRCRTADSSKNEALHQRGDSNSPYVVLSMRPGTQTFESGSVQADAYHPAFNFRAVFDVPDAPVGILLIEVRSHPTGLLMARQALQLDALREGLRWLPLRSPLGNELVHGGLLVFAEFSSR